MNYTSNRSEEINGLVFQLNEKKYTAQISEYSNIKNIFIPRSIISQSHEYIVTSIDDSLNHPYEVDSITFADDSEIIKIGNLISFENIHTLFIPPKVEKLTENLLKSASKLVNISISPRNKNFIYFDEKMILGKSDNRKDNYDCLIFARRDIEKVWIPSFVKHINSYAFYQCTKLKEVTFSEDSQLLSIEASAFAYTSIESLTFTQNLIELKSGWCKNTLHLTDIKISSKNENFQFLDENHQIVTRKSKTNSFDSIVFASRNIKKAYIPSQIKYIESHSFSECKQLESIEFSENSELALIKSSSFYQSSLNEIIIPRHVIKIGKLCFAECVNLKKIEFEENSELCCIKPAAFMNTNIKTILIPSGVKYIDEHLFFQCKNLRKVEFDKESQVTSICECSFAETGIISITIPKNVITIDYRAFFNCKKLREFKFEEGSQVCSLGREFLFSSKVEKIIIPPNVTEINPSTFISMDYLNSIEFTNDSNLTSIGKNAIRNSSIEMIDFPSKLVDLGVNWCNSTYRFTKIRISPQNRNFDYLDDNHKIVVGKSNFNSNIYDVLIFASRDIINITIPSFIKKINTCCFADCKYIRKVEFMENSNLQLICVNAFSNINIKNIILPNKVNFVMKDAFSFCEHLSSVECLGEFITFEDDSFNACEILIISFPNCHEIKYGYFNEYVFIFVLANAKIFNTIDEYTDGYDDENSDDR